MARKDIDIENIEKYSVEELEEYIRLSKKRPIVKRHIKIKEAHAWCFGVNVYCALVLMVPLATMLNITSKWGVMLSFGGLVFGAGLIEFLICRVYVFVDSRFKIDITK